jgi:hypothetical protein
MNTLYALVFLAFLPIIGKSQEYSFPLYFEDSAGNKDTLFFGFDQSASFDIDEKFGEVNLLGQPYDSDLFAFFSDAATKEEYDCRLENEKNPTYLTKKQYINLWNDQFIEIGLITTNWPVKISWDQNASAEFDIENYIGLSKYGLFVTSWRPLNGYPDSFCCGEWPDSNGLTWLSESTQIQITESNACLYKANSLNDSISLVYIGRFYKETAITDFQLNMLQCWYDELLETISIQNNNGTTSLKIEVFNIWGVKVMQEEVHPYNETQININIQHLPCGLYIARISSIKDNSLNSKLKIIKR